MSDCCSCFTDASPLEATLALPLGLDDGAALDGWPVEAEVSLDADVDAEGAGDEDVSLEAGAVALEVAALGSGMVGATRVHDLHHRTVPTGR